MEKNYRVGIITAEQLKNSQMGSSRLRGRNLVRFWKNAELYQIGQDYDVLIFQKVWHPKHAILFKGIKILDICDPDWLMGLPINEMVNHVDAITCSSEELSKWMRTYTDKPVVTIIDRDLPLDSTLEMVGKLHKGLNAKLVGWFGYSDNQVLLDKFIPTLKKLRLKLRVISDQNPSYLKAQENIKFKEEDYEKYIKECDFMLLPKSDIGKFKYKSENKKITSWRLGIPVAENTGDIFRYTDINKRDTEAKARLAEYPQKWDIRISVNEFKRLIETLFIARR